VNIIRTINPLRLTVLTAFMFFTALSAFTGSWKKPLGYYEVVRGFQFRIVAEDYAAKKGTTVEAINKKFQDRERERYNSEISLGLPECSFFFTNGKPCARKPIVSGGPLIGFPKDTFSELFEANKRASPSLLPFLIDFFIACSAAVMLILIVPKLAYKIWIWLQGGRSEGL
jgi:hypothetical protein